MKWILFILVHGPLIVMALWFSVNIATTVTDLWQGLPGPEYHTARVMSSATMALQASAILLLALPLFSHKPQRSEVLRPAIVLSTSLTLLWGFMAATIHSFTIHSGVSDPAWEKMYRETRESDMVAITTLGCCLLAAVVLYSGKLITAMRKTRDTGSYIVVGVVAVFCITLTMFVYAVRWADRTGESSAWRVPVVKSPKVLTLPYYDICDSCGEANIIGSNFDELDYELLSDVLNDQNPQDTFLFWVSPYGPGLGHMDGWAEDPYSDLQKEMPHLRHDTYDSFIERNKTAAVHVRPQIQTRDGQVIRIAGDGSRNIDSLYYSRAGFSTDGTQALISSGRGSFSVWERAEGTWRLLESKASHWLLHHMN